MCDISEGRIMKFTIWKTSFKYGAQFTKDTFCIV